MAVTITRTAWTDDDGSGTTGTVINNAVKTELYGQIDAALATLWGAAAIPDSALSANVPLKNAANVFTADQAVSATKKVILSGAGGTSYIVESSAGVVDIYAGGAKALSLPWAAAAIPDSALSANVPLKNAANVFTADQAVSATKKVILSGAGGTSYIVESSAGVVDIYAGGAKALSLPWAAAAIPDSALSANVPLKNAANTFTAGQTIHPSSTSNAYLYFGNSSSGLGLKGWADGGAGLDLTFYAGGGLGHYWYVNAGATPSMSLSSAGVLTLNALATGSLTSASGVITSSSDERMKDISGPLEYGLAEVLRLKPIRFHWREDSGIPSEPEYGGFGAIQVEESMPLAVSVGLNGMRGLSDRVILGALVNAVRELNDRMMAEGQMN